MENKKQTAAKQQCCQFIDKNNLNKYKLTRTNE
jgi:hypothetical protein